MFNTPLTAAAWKTKPSWGIVAGSDQIINPDLERWYYARAKSKTTVIEGASHSVYESHPKEVAVLDASPNRAKRSPPNMGSHWVRNGFGLEERSDPLQRQSQGTPAAKALGSGLGGQRGTS